MNKYTVLLLLCVLSFWGQAQEISLQELVNRKQYAPVIARADSLTAADSANYVTMSAIGQAYEGVLEYQKAYLCYQHCLQMDTTNFEALSALARVAINLGKASVAKECFLKVLDNDSTDFYANYQLARLYAQIGDYENAVMQFNVLRDQDTTVVNPVIYRNIADCYMKMNSIPAATICYYQAYNVNRENAGPASALINCLLRMGGTNIPDALAICNTALYYNPGNHSLLRNKAMGYYMNKQYPSADTLYSGLLAEGDSSFLTLKYGGASRYLAGRAMDAIDLLELAYQKDTTDVESTLLLGAALGKTYDRKRAFQLFDKAELLMQPNEALTNLLLVSRGETLWKDGRSRESEKLFYKAWLANKDRLDLLFRLEQKFPNWGPTYDSAETPEEERARAMFVKVTFLKEYLPTGKSLRGFHIYRPLLQYMYEDAFFQKKDGIDMIAPDGKKSKISAEDLKSIIDQLPEVPEAEKKLQKQIEDSFKQKQLNNMIRFSLLIIFSLIVGCTGKQSTPVCLHYEYTESPATDLKIKLSGALQNKSYRIRMAHFKNGKVTYKILNEQPL